MKRFSPHLLLTAALGAVGVNLGNSYSNVVKNDPQELTQKDLDTLAKAKLKRERKAQAKAQQPQTKRYK